MEQPVAEQKESIQRQRQQLGMRRQRVACPCFKPLLMSPNSKIHRKRQYAVNTNQISHQSVHSRLNRHQRHSGSQRVSPTRLSLDVSYSKHQPPQKRLKMFSFPIQTIFDNANVPLATSRQILFGFSHARPTKRSI